MLANSVSENERKAVSLEEMYMELERVTYDIQTLTEYKEVLEWDIKQRLQANGILQ